MTFPHSDKYRIPVRALAAAMMLTALQGCVAAAVIPVIAGSAIATTEARGGSSEDQDKAQQEPAPDIKVEADKPVEAMASDPASEGLSMAELAAEEIASQTDSAKNAANASEEMDLEPVPSVFADMTAYVLEVIQNEQSPKAGQSALLINPSRLDARRTKCEAFGTGAKRPPAVLIDLDDKNGIFDPNVVAPTYDGDAYGHLSRLREAGVTIGWMSALTAADAGGIRKALQASGLDVEGSDELVLFRYPDDRKQTRRGEFGSAFCLIAIAGDDRADFDELYQYLLKPNGAASLEPLIGNGWFLLPTGLSMRSAKQDTSEAAVNETDKGDVVQAEPEKPTEPEAELPPLN